MPLMFPGSMYLTAGAWLASATATFTQNSNAWNGFTVRQVIPSSAISNVGGTATRVTFHSGGLSGCVFDAAYIGHAAAAGDAYDFESTPVQLLFSGSGGATMGINVSLVSDSCSFIIQSGKNIVISAHFSGVSEIKASTSMTGWQGYYKNASDAATVNATGYSSGLTDYFVENVESFH